MNLLDSKLASKMDNKSHSFSEFLCEKNFKRNKIFHLKVFDSDSYRRSNYEMSSRFENLIFKLFF
jgi:hypothetical protein